MWLSLPLVIGIIISWIHGMSTENICNPAKNNKKPGDVCNLSAYRLDNLLVASVSHFTPSFWSLGTISSASQMDTLSLPGCSSTHSDDKNLSSAEVWRQEDTEPNILACLARQGCGPYHNTSQLPAAASAQRALHTSSPCTPWESRCWMWEQYIFHM